MVNMLQRMNLGVVMRDVIIALENIHINGDSHMTIRIMYQYSIIPKGMDMLISNSDIDKDNSEHYDEGHHQVE
jgi:hypothetical protein